MFELIRGILVDKEPHRVTVEASGVGYRLFIPVSAYASLPDLNAFVLFFLSQVVREDAHTLYAFLGKEERDLFELLLTISGIGPKTALGFIGHMELSTFYLAVEAADIRLLSTIPGIGKKSAERLVIEMRDKLKGVKRGVRNAFPSCIGASLASDAMYALINLGYAPQQAQKAVHAAVEEQRGKGGLSEVITSALQKI